MKRIIVCDSGLGGLNIASRFFRDRQAEKCELIYFNAYPARGRGFNTLPDDHAREELFREVLESMKRFQPDRCLIACNTLSIVYESLRKYYQPPFPVEVILDDAVSAMGEALRKVPEGTLLILGTKTTAGSGLYQKRLLQQGIAPERIYALACPGLATMLEKGPAAPEVAVRIRQYAEQAGALFARQPEKLMLALCCTHFEFAAALWKKIFSEYFGPVEIINPNDRMKTGFSAQKFRYLSRIGFVSDDGARENMVRYFEREFPEIASELQKVQPDPSLFPFQE